MENLNTKMHELISGKTGCGLNRVNDMDNKTHELISGKTGCGRSISMDLNTYLKRKYIK